MASAIKIIASLFILMIGFPIFIGGSAILLFVPLFQDYEGYFMSSPNRISSDDLNVNFTAIRLDIPLDDVEIGVRIDPSKFITLKMEATQSVFAGLCDGADANSLLAGSTYLLIEDFDYYSGWEFGEEENEHELKYEIKQNTTNWTLPPVENVNWIAGGHEGATFWWSPTYETLTSQRTISLIIMHSDLGASNNVDITFSIGAKIPIINAIGWILLIFGGLFSLLGIILLWSGLRTKKSTPERMRYYQGAPTARVEAVERPPPKYQLQCSNCGSLNEPDSTFCSQCGEILLSDDRKTVDEVVKAKDTEIYEPTGSKLVVAEGWPRFWAWLIDFVIVSAIASTISSIVFFAMNDWTLWEFGFWSPFQWLFSVGPSSVIFFLYCIVMEYYYGQTIGKMILNLEVVSERTGERPTLGEIAISALGKAFFLPIDVILGILVEDKGQIPKLNQRITQKWAKTVIIQQQKKKEVSARFVSGRI